VRALRPDDEWLGEEDGLRTCVGRQALQQFGDGLFLSGTAHSMTSRRLAGPRWTRLRTVAEQLGDIGVAQIAEVAQDHSRPLAERKPEEEIPELEELPWDHQRRRRRLVATGDNGSAVMGAAGVDDRSPQVAGGMVERQVAAGPQEDVVDEVLGRLVGSVSRNASRIMAG